MLWMTTGLLVALTAQGGDPAGIGNTGHPAAVTGLASLSGALNGTGRIAATTLPAGTTADVGRSAPVGDDVAIHPVPAKARGGDDASGTTASDPGLELSYEHAEPSLAACRMEVARRRRVQPAQVAAGAVVLRWTVEPDGHVRNAETVAAADTDLQVSACAKRVISEWVFSKPASGRQSMERTFRFP